MVKVRDNLEEASFKLIFSQRGVGKDVLEIGLKRDASWREEIVGEEGLAATELLPVIVSFLHSEKFTSHIDTTEWLPSRELDPLTNLLIMNIVSVPLKRNRVVIRCIRLQMLANELCHANLQLHIRDKLCRIFTLFRMVRLCKVIER